MEREIKKQIAMSEKTIKFKNKNINHNGTTNKEKIYHKFGGRCAYSGTRLNWDWTIDHYVSRCHHDRYKMNGVNDFNNLLPTHREINEFKANATPREFRRRLQTLHVEVTEAHARVEDLTKEVKEKKENGTVKYNQIQALDHAKKRVNRLMRVAFHFGISNKKPFDGVFFFEDVERLNRLDEVKKLWEEQQKMINAQKALKGVEATAPAPTKPSIWKRFKKWIGWKK